MSALASSIFGLDAMILTIFLFFLLSAVICSLSRYYHKKMRIKMGSVIVCLWKDIFPFVTTKRMLGR